MNQLMLVKQTIARFRPCCLVTGLVAGLALSLVACGGAGSGSSTDNVNPVPFDPVVDQYQPGAINIVSINNLSSVRNAVLMGVKHVNDAGGVLGKPYHAMAYIAVDAQESVELVQAVLKTDVEIYNVSFSSRSKAVAELTVPREKLLISESATSTFFTDLADNDFYFRLAPSDVYQGQVLAEIAAAGGAKTAVTIFNETDQYGETLAREFVRNFTLLGGVELKRIAIPFSVENGFDSYLQTIQDNPPDLILNGLLTAGIAANFVNEAGSFNLSAKFLLPDASAGNVGFVNSIASFTGLETAFGTSPGFGLVSDPQMMYFVQQYKDQFGIAPDAFTANGYDFALISALAIEHAGLANNTTTPSGKMIRDSLRQVMNPPGEAVGPLNIAQGLAWIRQGVEINFVGTYGAIDWDANGDIVGELTYDVLRIDTNNGTWVTDRQAQIIVPLE